ncbi:MAG TPA: hypothetical protein PKC43_14480 [Phycisphaerales bacterium]|nr:hypothetical protein [Phycisphaerales bacterium]HMP38641.1 hypothetical protein [Phycisphaerales bacterium]
MRATASGDPLITTVIDLDEALGGNADLLLVGGLGLFLKQQHLQASGARTLLPIDRWPTARTTQDIDLMLRAEVVASTAEMARYRAALDGLGFVVDDAARWMKFTREVDGKRVVIDLMVGPLGSFAGQVERDSVRVRPAKSSGLHARATDDALGIEASPLPHRIADANRSCEVLLPQAFPFALMKLGALRDRLNDANKDEGRHHALDLYRIVAMLTAAEDAHAANMAAQHAGDPVLVTAITTAHDLFSAPAGLGRLRLMEHPLCPRDADLDWFARELLRLLSAERG